MTDNTRHAAADLLAAMTDDEFSEFARTARDPARTRQLTRDDLTRMSSDAIVAAKAAGRLDNLLGINHN